MGTLYLLITTTFTSLYAGIALPIIGFATILALEVINLISEGIKFSVYKIVLWVGLVLALIGPILVLVGFQENYEIMFLAGIVGVIGPATGNPIGYMGFVLYPSAPYANFNTGIALTFVGFGVILASKIIEKIKS